MMNVCTIVARNYLAHARVFAESFLAHHPAAEVTALVLDETEMPSSLRRERFRMLRPSDIGTTADEMARLATMYDLTELATALKPSLLAHLVDAGAERVMYFDPDILLLESVDDLHQLAGEHAVVLTPHLLEPPPSEAREPLETTILLAGMYNLGFVAVSADARPFLDWWARRLARDCLIAPERGRFVDQRWVDFAPVLFDCAVVRDRGCNVAWWNLHEREVTWTGDRYETGGVPLRFFHFSGFDANAPWILTKHLGPRPATLLSERPALARLCADYRMALLRLGFLEASTVPYGFAALGDGTSIDSRMRRLYRDAVRDAEGKCTDLPPPAFDPSDRAGAAFLDWLRDSPDPRGPGALVSRYLRAVHQERADLQAAFPDLRWRDAPGFLDWARSSGQAEGAVPKAFAPSEAVCAAARAADPGHQWSPPDDSDAAGVVVAGYLRAELGIGEAARALIAGLRRAGLPYSTLTYRATLNRQDHPFENRVSEPAARAAAPDVNIVCVNADQMLTFVHDVGPDFFAGRHTVGFWFWEATRFPDAMHPAFHAVDEVWTGSEYARSAISAAPGAKPVFTFPIPIAMPAHTESSRRFLGLPEGFLFLFMFDFLSVFERKNPLGLVDAFCRAFAPGEGPTLLIKTINGEREVALLERLRAATAERPDILVRDGYLSAADTAALMATCDCYASLHRSEGFGLTMAEAMSNGKPVIATGYSGNLTFMDEQTSYLVRHVVRPVGLGCAPYPPDAEWADPDLEHAASLMQRVWAEPAEAAARGLRGREHIRRHHSPERAAEFLGRRLDQIRAGGRRCVLSSGNRERPPVLGQGREAAPRAAASLPEPVARARAYISNGPSLAWESSSRAGAVGRLGRRGLRRFLRPLLLRQRELEEAVVESIVQLAEDSQRASPFPDLVEQPNPGVRWRLTRLESSVRDAAARFREVAERLATLDAEASDVRGLTEPLNRYEELSAVVENLRHATDRLATDGTRMLRDLQTRVGDLDRRVARHGELIDATPYLADSALLLTTDARGLPAIGGRRNGSAVRPEARYRAFEDIFRGSEDFIRDRQQRYLDVLEGHEPVLDIGCGRGEFLDLMAKGGRDARGIDIDPAMVARCREKGHSVERADAIDYLRGLPEDSLGAIFCAQVVEHLPHDSLRSLLSLSRAKLAPAGVLVMETVNPESLRALKAFWVDPTHRAPIFPEVAVTLCLLHGFDSAIVLFPNGCGDLSTDRVNEGEYAVVATVSSGGDTSRMT